MMYKSAPASRTASVKARLSVPAFLEKVAIATRRPVFAPSGVRNQRQKPMRFLAGPVTELASIIASIRRVGGSFTRVAASFVFGSSLHSIYWEGWKNDGMPPTPIGKLCSAPPLQGSHILMTEPTTCAE